MRDDVELLLVYFWLRYDFMTLWNLEFFYSLLGTFFNSDLASSIIHVLICFQWKLWKHNILM